jgi:hypothetical protein
MKVFFEIHTTSGKPIMCAVDSEHTMDEIYETILFSIENYTILGRASVRDIFMQNNNHTSILSIRPGNNDTFLGEYMDKNEPFFKPQSVSQMAKIYTMYVIDDIYLQRKSENKSAPIYDDSTLYEQPSFSITSIIKQTIGAFYIKL